MQEPGIRGYAPIGVPLHRFTNYLAPVPSNLRRHHHVHLHSFPGRGCTRVRYRDRE